MTYYNPLANTSRNAPIHLDGAPSNGTDEVQTVTVTGTPTGGTFALEWRGRTTTPIAYNANSATVQAALEALSNIGSGNVAASGTLSGGMTITFQGNLEKKAWALLELADNSLTGGTSPNVTIVETVTGVNASGRGALPGRILVDTDDGIAHINKGTQTAPVWGTLVSRSIEAAAADGAITIPDADGEKTVVITKGSAAALTLGLPTSTQNGAKIHFVSATAFAHTVTRATEGFNDLGASGDVATFAAAKGNGFTVVAYEGDWFVLSNIGVTIA